MGFEIRRTLTILMLVLLESVSAWGQTYFHQNQAGVTGPAITFPEIVGTINVGAAPNVRTYELDPRYTGSGFRWYVTYTLNSDMTPAPHIDVLCQDGQSLGRWWEPQMPGGIGGGSFDFHGDDHPEARPVRIRFTFAHESGGHYTYRATIRVVPVIGANVGGLLREKPQYMAMGSASDPSCVTGSLRITYEYHRFCLFYLRAHSELKMKVQSRNGDSPLHHSVWDTDHHLLYSTEPTQYASVRVGPAIDVHLFTNDTDAPRFIIVGFMVYRPISDLDMQFYSPQGPAPVASDAVTPPLPHTLNPYIPINHLVTQAPLLASGSQVTTSFILPGDGEMERIRLRVGKIPFLVRGSGVYVRAWVYSKTGQPLHTYALSLHGDDTPRGHGPNELYFEYSGDGTPANSPGRLDVLTQYDPCLITVDATRYLRRPGGDTTPPVVSITSPTEGAAVAAPISVQVDATDQYPLGAVKVYLDDTVLVGATDRPPYAFPLDPGALTLGVHFLRAEAQDLSGNIGTSTVTHIVVQDLTAPTVAITSPGVNATVKGVLPVVVTANDARGISAVKLYLGTTLVAQGTGPGTLSFNTNAFRNGTYALKAVATDGAGNTATAGPITIKIVNPPLMVITAPVVPTPTTPSAWAAGRPLAISWRAGNFLHFRRIDLYLDGGLRASTGFNVDRASAAIVLPAIPAAAAGNHNLVVMGTTAAGLRASARIILRR